MVLRNTRKLDKFLKKHQTARIPIEVWIAFVSEAEWKGIEDVKTEYPHIRRIDKYRLVFKIGGNNWRIYVEIDYSHRIVFIKRVGTHEEYNKWTFAD